MITAETHVDDMVQEYPLTVRFLMRKGLPCVVCGEAFWGTLAELCKQKGWNDEQIEALVQEFNRTVVKGAES